MAIGILFIALFAGGVAAISTLLAGGSLIVAGLIYMSAGSLTVFLIAAVQVLREDLSEFYAAREARS